MADQKTLPCPFCGEQPEVTKHFKRDEYCLVHRCEYIPAHMDFTTMAGILKRWNARADPASPIHPCHAHLVMPERMLHTSYVAGVIPSNAADVSAHRDGWNACLEEVARINASPAVPKGWKLVPTNPEQIQMVHTAFNLSGKYGVDFVSANKEFALDVYREMLDAAPCSDSVCRANCSSKPSYTDVANIHATALELCDVIENRNDLQMHKWALKSAYLVSKLRARLELFTVSQPKGSMCASCKHVDRNCSHLAFSAMRPSKKYSDGSVAVICTEFERKREVKNGG